MNNCLKGIHLLLVILLSTCQLLFAQKSIVMQHNDMGRTGWNNQEYILNQSNVRPGSFGKLFTRTVDDHVYAQPLVVLKLNMPGIGIRNVVYVSTVNNSVYAFDADSANLSNPYWRVNVTPSHSRATSALDFRSIGCNDRFNSFLTNVGIVGTPVIDTTTNTIFFVARSFDTLNQQQEQYLHALDITTGAEKNNSPVLIAATVAGTGDGSVNGMVSFNAWHQNQRAALLLLNSMVVICWGSHCDWPPYHGWVMSYNKTTLQQKTVYAVTPDGEGGGIWMSGAGPSADENGNFYAAAGDGTVGTSNDALSSRNRGSSILKFHSTDSSFTLNDFFTPNNYRRLTDSNLDMGPTGVMLLPNTKIAITACKSGQIFVVNRDSLGTYYADSNRIIQSYQLAGATHVHASFAYYKGAQKENVYLWGEGSDLKSFPFDRANNKFNFDSTVAATALGAGYSNGAFMSVSSNGSNDASAILWASHTLSGVYNPGVARPGMLRAFDANNINNELWNSRIDSNDIQPSYARFVCPTIINGKVYLATFSNQLIVYGLAGGNANACGTANIALNKPAYASSTKGNNIPSHATDNNASSKWASNPGDPQYIYVDLQARYNICKVVLKWANVNAKEFKIQVSDDATNWSDAVSILGNKYNTNILLLNGAGRYVRMYGTSSKFSNGYSLKSFEVYGTSNAPLYAVEESGHH